MRNSLHRSLGLTVLLFLFVGASAACSSSPKTKPGGTGSGSNTPPTVQSTVPTQSGTMLGSNSSSAAIEVTFNTEMMASSFEGGAFQVLADDNPVAGSIRMGDAASKVLFVFNEPMVTGQSYTVQLQGVRSRTDLLMASYETVVVGP